jgi:hypothetical protein
MQSDEIIADIDNIAEREINTFLSNFLELQNKLINDLKASNLRKSIDKKVLEKYIQEFTSDVVKKVSDYLNIISSIFFASQKTGLLEEAKAGLVLFKVDKVKLVERQLRHKNKKFELYQSLQPFITEGSYFKIVDHLEKKKNVKRGKADLWNF